MQRDFDVKTCHYPNCGFNPEYSAACARIRKAFGSCSGPCDGPCYIVSDLNLAGHLIPPVLFGTAVPVRD